MACPSQLWHDWLSDISLAVVPWRCWCQSWNGSCLCRSRPECANYELEARHLCLFQSVLSLPSRCTGFLKIYPILKFSVTGSISQAWKTDDTCFPNGSIKKKKNEVWKILFSQGHMRNNYKSPETRFGRDIFLLELSSVSGTCCSTL